MADNQKQDDLKFNVNTLYSVKDVEGENTLNFGAYNGQIQISIRPAKFNGDASSFRDSLKSTNCNYRMGFLIVKVIDDVLANARPGYARALVFMGKWNPESKKRVASFSFVVGMDDEGKYYIGIKCLDKNDNTWKGKFPLVGDRYLEVSELYDDPKTRGKVELSTIQDLFASSYLNTASLFTRNKMVTYNGGKGGNSNRGGGSQQGSEAAINSSLDEVPF